MSGLSRVTIRKKGNAYYLRYRLNGRRYEEAIKTTRLREAELVRAKREAEIFEGRWFPEKARADLSVEELAERWFKHAAAKRSLDVDRDRFERIVGFFGKHTRVADIDRDRVVEFRAALLVTPARNRGVALGDRRLAPSTVNRHLALLRSALRLAKQDGFVVQPAFTAGLMLEEDNARDRLCSPEELERIVEAADVDLGRLVTLLYWTACRLSEIATLTWGLVDLERGMLKLRWTKTGKPRNVPLPEPARELMGAMHKERKPPRAAQDRVFAVREPSSYSSAFKRLTGRLGIEDLRLHDMRHTALTRLRRAGVDVLTMQRISGHATLAMLARYNTVDDEDLRTAVAHVTERQVKH